MEQEKISHISQISKISWVDYYMGIAFVVAQKSPDIHTKVGCVITNSSNQPLGFGFNGFPRKAKDDEYLRINCTERPIKHFWMCHAETNALANCVVRPNKAIAYVTGQCCNNCLYSLWQNGVETVYMGNQKINSMTQEILDWEKGFIEQTGIKIYKVAPNLKFILDLPVEIFDNSPLGRFTYREEEEKLCQPSSNNSGCAQNIY